MKVLLTLISSPGQGAAISLMAFYNANDLLAIGANNSAVVWYCNPTWQLERMIGTPDNGDALEDRVTSLSFSWDGKLLASGGGEPSRSGERIGERGRASR